MNAAGIYQMCTFLFVKAVKVRNVLEVVGIEIAALYNQVGLYIIIKNCDLKIIALFSQKRFRLLQDLGVRCCGCGNLDGSQLAVSSLGSVSSVLCGICGLFRLVCCVSSFVGRRASAACQCTYCKGTG